MQNDHVTKTGSGQIKGQLETKMVFSQYAVGVIHNHSSSSSSTAAPAAQPLFLNYNMHVVHEPLQAPHAYFTAQAVLTNATYPDAPNQPRAIYHSMVRFAVGKTPLFAPFISKNDHLPRQARDNTGKVEKEWRFPQDDCLGNLTAALKSTGMWKDTVVVVTSDNGGPMYRSERLFRAILNYKGSFYQDRLGTNIGKALKRGCFLTATMLRTTTP